MLQVNGFDPSNINLVLNYAPLGLVRALHVEYGTQKMLVNTGCVTLAEDSEVDVMLSIGGPSPDFHFIRAKVTGSHPDGVILAFQHCDAATTKALLPYITIH
jgi:hypothetical protein